MIIKTKSGSAYEVDWAAMQARRLSGQTESTSRMPDGAWRTFNAASEPTIGLPMFFAWADETVGVPAAPGHIPGTQTSRVVEIQP